MKKLIPLLLLVVLPSAVMRAGMPRISWGLEWGYNGTFLKTAQRNFICNEGYRIVENPTQLSFFSNGSVLANAGVDLTGKLNLSLYSGLQGVYSKRWMVPLELRVRWCPSGLYSDGLIVTGGGGLAFPTAPLRETCFRARAGAGYRVALNKCTSVDFLFSWMFTTDKEILIDPDTHAYVPPAMISKNFAEYQAVTLSVALNF